MTAATLVGRIGELVGDEIRNVTENVGLQDMSAFAKALVTGENLGQVASQTMEALGCTEAVTRLPVLRPLIGFDKQEIVTVSEKIGTYQTSMQPFEDCCTIFVAKHPVTKPNINIIKRSERNLEERIDELFKKAIETKELIIVE